MERPAEIAHLNSLTRRAHRERERQAEIARLNRLARALRTAGLTPYATFSRIAQAVLAAPDWMRTRRLRAIAMLASLGLLTISALPARADDLLPDNGPTLSSPARIQSFAVTGGAAAGTFEAATISVVIVDVPVIPADLAASGAAALRAWNKAGQPSAADILRRDPRPYTPEGVLDVAERFLGVPYVFAGETPAGMDCSGYTRYVFAHFGIDLPHSASRQSYSGTRVTAQRARPGDLIVWNDGSHVGIYAGNGQMYHAPRRGTTVVKEAVYSDAVHYVRITQ